MFKLGSHYLITSALSNSGTEIKNGTRTVGEGETIGVGPVPVPVQCKMFYRKHYDPFIHVTVVILFPSSGDYQYG